MREVSVIIPNYNGMQYLKGCLDALAAQTFQNMDVLVVDNGSTDGSCGYLQREYPWVRLIALPENTGFCHAVNVGIQASDAPYVLLLNNDTEAEPRFVEEMTAGILRHDRAFSCAARMIQFCDRELLDDAGNYYSALGWAFARGKGKPLETYTKEERIFAACGGAAIYRRELLEKIGLFDEAHFAYLEDIDIGYRARIHGYENWYLPKARVYHVGSGTSGSRYNLFKIRYSSRNNVYMLYKNMPLFQLLLNLPLLAAGFFIKFLFFASKKFGREYAAGIKNGCSLALEGRRRGKKVRFQWKNLQNYAKIQMELWINIFRRLV